MTIAEVKLKNGARLAIIKDVNKDVVRLQLDNAHPLTDI